jgi:hypothetical protein
MKFNKEQLQSIIDDKSQAWGITEKNLTAALEEIREFDVKKNKDNASKIYTKGVLKDYLRKVHNEQRRAFVVTGDAEKLKNVYEVFPIGTDGHQDVSELMTWKAAMKDDRVLWNRIQSRQQTGSERAFSAVLTMDAFAKLAGELADRK